MSAKETEPPSPPGAKSPSTTPPESAPAPASVPGPATAAGVPAWRRRRQAEALRANLRRRKQGEPPAGSGAA